MRTVIDGIRNVTTEAKKAGEAMGQMGHGGGPAPLAVGGVGAAGSANSAAPLGGRQANEGITRWVGGLKEGVRQAADGMKAFGRTMGDALRDAANQGEPHLRRLQAAVQGVLDATHKLPAAGTGRAATTASDLLGPTPQQFQGVFGGVAGPGGRPAGGRYNVAARLRAENLWAQGGQVPQGLYDTSQGPDQAPPGAGGPGGGGPGGRSGKGKAGGGGGLFGSLDTSNIPYLGNALRFGALGGAAYLGYKAFQGVTGSLAATDTAEAGENFASPFYAANRRAAIGQHFGGQAVGVLQGDLSLARAIKAAAQDPEYKKLQSTDMTNLRLSKAASDAGAIKYENLKGEKDFSLTGATTGNIAAVVKQGIQKGISDGFKAVSAGIDTGSVVQGAGFDGMGIEGIGVVKAPVQAGKRDEATSAMDVKLRKSQEQDVLIENLEAQRRYVAQKQAEAPMFNYQSQRLMGSAFGTMSMLRAAGLGNREVRDKKTKEFQGWSGDIWGQRMQEMGFDPGEAAGMRAQLGRTAGRGNMGLGTTAMMAGAGGLFNAPDILGAGAQLGGARGPGGFFKGVQGAVGAGGLDVTAGATLAGSFGQLALQGHAGIGGEGDAFQAFAGAAYVPGHNAGQDLRAANNAAGGMQALGDLFGGRTDPLGQSLTRRAALKGARGRGSYVADAIERALGNPVEMASIMSKDGQVPPGLAALGIEKKDLQAAWNEQNLQNTIRTVQRALPMETPAGKMAAKVRAAGGDLTQAVKGMVHEGLGDKRFGLLETLRKKGTLSASERKESDRLEKEAYGIYSPGLKGLAEIQASDAGGKFTGEQVEQSLEQQLGIGGFGRRVRGRGAGDTIGRSAPQKRAAKIQGGLTGANSKLLTPDLVKDIEAAGKDPVKLVEALTKAQDTAQGAAGAGADWKDVHAHLQSAVDLVASILDKKLTPSLDKLASRIDRVAEGGPGARSR